MLGHVVAHFEQGIEPPALGCGIEIVADGEHAVIKALSLGDDGELAWIDRAVLAHRQRQHER